MLFYRLDRLLTTSCLHSARHTVQTQLATPSTKVTAGPPDNSTGFFRHIMNDFGLSNKCKT